VGRWRRVLRLPVDPEASRRIYWMCTLASPTCVVMAFIGGLFYNFY
jgi:hypothetical protein